MISQLGKFERISSSFVPFDKHSKNPHWSNESYLFGFQDKKTPPGSIDHLEMLHPSNHSTGIKYKFDIFKSGT